MKYFTVSILLALTVCYETKNLSCFAVWKDTGFICLCNKTYCDTIERPRKLKEREYHVYSTSNAMPGFNHHTRFFKIRSPHLYGLNLEVNPNITKQKIRGFGSSFTDSFGYSFNRLSVEAQNNLLKSVFSIEGIEYNLCRVVLGSSDFSLNEYSYVPDYDPSLNTFNLTIEDYKNKIWIIKGANALSKRKINFLGSTWTAPAWMKKNKKSTTGYLEQEFEQTWAAYHVKSLDAFKKEGVNFWGLTTGNEPLTLMGMKTEIPNLVMFPEQQRKWISENLGPSLKKAGYENISIILLDDQRKYAYWWIDTVLRSEKAKEFVNGIGLHWYWDADVSPLIMDKIYSKYPNQEMLYTESSINPAVNLMNSNDPEFEEIHPKLGDWKRASLYITSIIEALLHRITGYIDWNMALDVDGGPTAMGFTCDSQIIINYNSDEFYKQPMFYAMGHFSKFLQPDSVIIDVQDISVRNQPNGTIFEAEGSNASMSFPHPFVYTDVKYIAASNPDKTTTIILFNPKNSSVHVTIRCSNKGYAYLTLEAESLSTIIY